MTRSPEAGVLPCAHADSLTSTRGWQCPVAGGRPQGRAEGVAPVPGGKPFPGVPASPPTRERCSLPASPRHAPSPCKTTYAPSSPQAGRLLLTWGVFSSAVLACQPKPMKTPGFYSRLLAVNGANYRVRAPICNSGDMTFPQAPETLGEVLSREGQTQVREVAARESQKLDFKENFQTYHRVTL